MNGLFGVEIESLESTVLDGQIPTGISPGDLIINIIFPIIFCVHRLISKFWGHI